MHSFVDQPLRFPHRCMLCGNGVNREYYIDFGDDDLADPTGNLFPTRYLCDQCHVALAKEKGLIDQGPLLAENERLKKELFEATIKADGLEQALDGLIRIKYIDPGSAVGTAYADVVAQHTTVRQDDAADQSGSSTGEGSASGGPTELAPPRGETPEPVDDSNVAGLRPIELFDGPD